MRKVLRCFVVLLAACGLFAVCANGTDAPFEHEHEYEIILGDVEQATCWQPGWEQYFYYCEECGQTIHVEMVEIRVEHEWSDWEVEAGPFAYCQYYLIEERYCRNSDCDEREFREVPNDSPHDYGSGYVVLQPTCQEEGLREYVCWYCYAMKWEPIPKTDHHMSEWIEDTSPLCFKDGIEGRYCLDCDYSETRPIPAYGEHDMSGWTVTTPATCQHEGVETNYCRRIRNLGMTEECMYEETRAIPKLDHTLGDWYVKQAPTCSAAGIEARKCTGCDYEETRELPMLEDHTMGQWTVAEAATCTETGWEKCLCTVCGFEVMRESDALGHSYRSAWTSDASGHWHVCSRCDRNTKKEDHIPGPEATESAPQTCTACGWEIAPALPPAETEKPTEVTTQPTEVTTQPTEAVTQPTEPPTQPVENTTVPEAPSTVPEAETTAPAGSVEPTIPAEKPEGPGYATVIVIAMLAGGAAGVAVLFLGKKLHWFHQ